MMIAGLDLWFWICVVLGTVSTVICVIQFLRGVAADDWSQGSIIVLQGFLMVYFVGSIIMQLVTDGPKGDWLEYYGYLLTAMIIPAGTLTWSLSERTKWSTLVLGVTGPVLIIMVLRMNQLWYYY
ncbi:hypothetical protein ACIP5Z_04775 [Rothia terrae]|nr:hypothetical protein [Rothia terrae]MDT0190064.1 hypothetical protein [Rothia terrae]